ncbi:hypothetical protein ABPG74_011333 [Tetrahymena malaccensis]
MRVKIERIYYGLTKPYEYTVTSRQLDPRFVYDCINENEENVSILGWVPDNQSQIVSRSYAQCLDGEIFNFLTKTCIHCSDNCSDCFNINEDQCTLCTSNFFKSQSNTSTCVQKCQLGEFETQDKQCAICQVEGCTKCDSNQNCLECMPNLNIDLVKNKCNLESKVCDSELNFVYSPYTKEQCVQSCPSGYYQNQNTQICEKTLQCLQIDHSSSSLNQTVFEISSFQQNLYLMRANKCTFALADQNFQIFDIQFLQSFSYSLQLQGSNQSNESFIIGRLGGCISNKTLTVMDFMTRQIIFQKQNMDLDYFVYSVDIQNQFVFFRDDSKRVLAWYDIINKSFITKAISETQIIGMFQLQNNNQTTYYIQKSYQFFQVAILQVDRSFNFLNSTLNLPSYQQLLAGIQKRDYLIGIFESASNEVNLVYKLTFKSITSFELKLIEQLIIDQFKIYYSAFLNSIIQYDTNLSNLQILVLSQFSDKIEYSYNITSSQLNNLKVYENELDSSTFVFFISDKLRFLNLTDYQIKYQLEQKNITDPLLQVIDTPFITNSTYQVQYFNPDQNQKLYVISKTFYKVVGQTQKQFSIEKNSFYIYDGFQTFAEKTIGVQKIQFNLQNLQKNPRINTRLINVNIEDDQLGFYDDVEMINNQILLIRNYDALQIQEYIFDLKSLSQVLTNINTAFGENIYFYIKKRNLLLILPSFQIISLDTYQQLLQNPQDLFQDFIIVNEDQIVYISQNEFQEQLLYSLDLQSMQIDYLYNFGLPYIFFYTIDNQYTPIMAFNDLIYFCFSEKVTDTFLFSNCQPFSLSQRKLVYQLTTIQYYAQQTPSINYQKTGDIFIFYQTLVFIYSFDLQSFESLNLEINYPTIDFNPEPLAYNQRYVFYYDQNYFYRFDMELKSISLLNARTDLDIYINYQIDFFALDDNYKYIKKSESIIDTENMIVIKSSLKNFDYIGSLLTDDNTQIDSFCSQDGVFWYLNLFNNPFSVVDITQNLMIQDMKLQNNRIALYDSINKYLIIYDITKSIQEIQQIKIIFTFDFSINIIDWDYASYFWIKDEIIYLYDSQHNSSYQIVAILDSNIQEYQYCSDQKILVAKTAQQSVYSIQIQSLETIYLDMPIQHIEVKFYVNCEEELIIVYYPFMNLFDLKTGIQPDKFLPNAQIIVGEVFNLSKMIPLISKNHNLIILFQDLSIQYFYYNSFHSSSYLFNYRAESTNLFYDFKNQILIGVTGNLNQVNIINIPGNQQLFIYKTVSQFTKDTAHFYLDQTSLIIVDNTPQIYLCNYLSKAITVFTIEIQNILGILMDESKNVVFFYSNQFIQTYQFPSMQFIETISLQQYNESSIQKVFLNTQLSIMTVLTQTRVISFDLTEILYSSETNLLQFQKIQSISLNYYVISSLDLNTLNPQEINLINFSSGDTSQSLILSNNIIIPSSNEIIIYDFILQQMSSIILSKDSLIKFIFKLQRKNYSDYSTKWWDIPFDYEERQNNNDSQIQNERKLCLLIQENDNLTVQIANIYTKKIEYTYQIKYQKITNIGSDPFRKLIYLVNNQGKTLIFSYTLNLLTTLQNACLKQAIISYDSDFIYSICPNDIIVYNGLSFQQQYPKINKGISEAVNFVNTKYNNHFLVIQKHKFAVVKLDFYAGYEVIFEINQSYQMLLNAQINQKNQLAYLELLFCSYEGIQNVLIPLQQNQICLLSIQQQNRSSENIYTNVKLSDNLNSLQTYNQKLSLIQIDYLDGQYNITILQSNQIVAFQVQQTQKLQISNFQISQAQSSSMILIKGCIESSIKQIRVENSNQLNLIQIQPLIIDNLQILSNNYQLLNMNLTNSTDIQLISDASITSIFNIQIQQLNISQNCFQITSDQLTISDIELQNSKSFTNNLILVEMDQQALIKINAQGNTMIQSCKFVEFELQKSLMELININNLIIDFMIVKNVHVNSTSYSSVIVINECKQVHIINSQFINNTNINGYGGAVYLTENSFVQIQNSTFKLNQCQSQNGGALSVQNIIQQGNLSVLNSVFIGNQAQYSTGGAINLFNSNMILKQSTISSNKAVIGGGIYYQQIIPDSIQQLNQGITNDNYISENFALFYGKNIGSTIRSLQINLKDITSLENEIVSYNQNNTIQLKQFRSGDQIYFKKILFIDEEGNPFQISSVDLTKYKLFSSDIQTLVDQLSISLYCDEQSQQLKCTGELQSKQYIDDGFKLSAQVIYKPLSQATLQIVSNNFPQILDSKGNIFIQQSQIYKNITFHFDDCQLGQIYKTQTSSIICEDCPEGYKGPLCYSCDTYGELWGGSYSQLFSSGKCYRCQENVSLIVFQNILLFLFTFLYVFTILKSIILKLQAKLAGYFLCQSNILFLGSTLIQSDKPSIISKILTDHLQILSLFSCFSVNIPNYFSVPLQFSGNTLNATSKSIDCILSKYPKLKPLWFYQALWSLILPLSLLLIYIIFALFYGLLKKSKTAIRYLNTACVFIYIYFFPMVITILIRSLNCINIGQKNYLDLDFSVRCFDTQYHLPFMIYFTLPLLIFWVFIIPLFIFLKIRKGKLKKWSIFIEIKYSFVFAGYREKYYYWEFGKLVYKSMIIFVSILLQQNQFLKVCLMNALILFQIYMTFKIQPYVIKNFNNLLQKSSILSALSLNLTSIISEQSKENSFLEIILMILLILPNLKFILELVIGMCFITISSDINKRNKLHKFLFYLKQKFPHYFENIQIQSQNKVRCLLKLKKVKSKIKMLSEFLKNNNLYTQQSLQQRFSLQNSNVTAYNFNNDSAQNLSKNSSLRKNFESKALLSPNNQRFNRLPNSSPKSKFILQGIKGQEKIKHEKLDSFQSMRDKWQYYTRKTKESIINQQSIDNNNQNQDYCLDSIFNDPIESHNSRSRDEPEILLTTEFKNLITQNN